MKLWRLYANKGYAAPGQRLHLDGIGDSYTLCGVDTAGDTTVHRKRPELVDATRVTCEDCLAIIKIAQDYLAER